MSERAVSPEAPAALPWWRRLHGALMPDYNRKAAVYWWLAAVAGAVVLAVAAWQVAQLAPSAWWQIAAGVFIAMTAGFFPVRV